MRWRGTRGCGDLAGAQVQLVELLKLQVQKGEGALPVARARAALMSWLVARRG